LDHSAANRYGGIVVEGLGSGTFEVAYYEAAGNNSSKELVTQFR